MKTSGAVYKKLKEVKFRHLIVLYKKYLKKVPENCKYNFPYELQGTNGQRRIIGLCLFHQENKTIKVEPIGPIRLSGIVPHLVDLCESDEDCQNCNAFVHKYDRQMVKDLFEKELSDKKTRETKYPDICALEWVLERSSVGILSTNGFFQKLIYGIKKLLGIKQE
jgi:hypothetical protein